LRGLDDPLLRPIIDHCGTSGRALMARRKDVGVRYFTDFFAVKQPTKQRRVGSGGAGSSDWHQDYASSGSDRSGGMVFWIALTDMLPEKGTMAFLSGSHRHGVMGHHSTYGDGNLIDHYPELLDDCTPTGNLTYAAGDATVHSNMTVHSACANSTDDPRWTYIVIVNPEDACYSGADADAFQREGLIVHQELNDGRFPVIG
jgi:ectoine hydroxylase-related dioxygenase (phytanoyl-CoA dioxygenase family)